MIWKEEDITPFLTYSITVAWSFLMMVKMTAVFLLIALNGFSFPYNLYAQDKIALAKLRMPVRPQDERPIIKKYSDLPNHTYKFQLKASDLFESEKHMLALAKEVKKNIQSDLKAHQFIDNVVLKWMYYHLFRANIIEQEYERALEILRKIKKLEEHKGKAQLWGIPAEAIARAHIQVNRQDGLKFNEVLKSIFQKQLSDLPWKVFKEPIKNMASETMLECKSYLLGDYLQDMNKIQAESEGEIDSFMANDLTGFWVSVNFILPHSDTLIDVYLDIINSHLQEEKNIWIKRSINLKKTANLTPVIAAIWDSGVDTSMFSGKLWRNEREKQDGLDNDQNGFVDDIHGIGFDLSGDRVSELMQPINNLSVSVDEAALYYKGQNDLHLLNNSLEARFVRRIRNKTSYDDYMAVMKNIKEYGHFAHGTFMADIVAEGNPFIRIQTVRADYHSREFVSSIELAEKYADAQRDTAQYFKDTGVRVVNMSWSESKGYMKSWLLQSGYDKPEEEADKLIDSVFTIISDSLYNCIKDAPDILFVTSAGNEGGNVEQNDVIPSIFGLPNLVSVAIANKEGGFFHKSCYGKTVQFMAHGVGVDCKGPGGFMVNSGGSSHACAKFVNLVAKLLAIDPTLTPTQIKNLIKKGSDWVRRPSPMYLINPRKTLGLLTAK